MTLVYGEEKNQTQEGSFCDTLLPACFEVQMSVISNYDAVTDTYLPALC